MYLLIIYIVEYNKNVLIIYTKGIDKFVTCGIYAYITICYK